MIGLGGAGNAAQKRTLELDIRINGDNSSASRAVTDLTNQTDKLTASLGKAHQEAAKINAAVRPLASTGAVSGIYSMLAAPPQGPRSVGYDRLPLAPPASAGPSQPKPASASGFWASQQDALRRPIEPTLGGFSAAAATAVGTLEAIRGLADIGLAISNLGRGAKTARDQLYELQEAIPIIGHATASLTRSALAIQDRLVDGSRARMVEAQDQFLPSVLAGIRGEYEGGRRLDSANLNVRAAGYNVSALRGVGREVRRDADLLPTYFSGQTQSEQGFTFQRTMSRHEVMRADAAVDAARRAAEDAVGLADLRQSQALARGSRASELGRRANTAQLELQRGRSLGSFDPVAIGLAISDPNFKDGGSAGVAITGTDAAAKRQAFQVAAAKAAGAEAAALTAQTDAATKLLELEKARTAAQKVRLASTQMELSITSQQEQQARGAAASYGALATDQRAELLAAAQQFKLGGFDSLSPQWKQLLLSNGVTGERAQQAAIDSAENDKGYRALQEEFGKEDTKTLEKRRVELQQRLVLDLQFDSQSLAEQVASAAKIVLRELLAELRVKIESISVQQSQLQLQGGQNFGGRQ